MNYKYKYRYGENLELYDKLVRIHLVVNNIELTELQTNILVYFCKYGISVETAQRIIKHRIATTLQVINNTKTTLKKAGLVHIKKYKSWVVTEKLRMDIENSLNIMILCKV